MTEPVETHACTGIELFAVLHSSSLTAEELLGAQATAERVQMLDGIGLLVCVIIRMCDGAGAYVRTSRVRVFDCVHVVYVYMVHTA